MSGSSALAQSLLGLGDRPPIEATLPDPMPTVPAPEAMIEFYVSPTTTNRFTIDPASLAIEDGRLVRFMLVVTSRSGARNVTYEAFRCDRGDRRLLAIGTNDGGWTFSPNSQWRPVNRGDTMNRQYEELYARVCSGSSARARTPKQLAEQVRSPASNRDARNY